MNDLTRVNDIQAKLLEAMGIVNAQALNSISFDKTITCTIENDKNKKDGKYEVSDGSRIFSAYSNDTKLRAGDVVYVTIPEGNFENQKMIIGKKTAENDKPFVFTTPFDTFFDMTGNLAATAQSGSLVANDILDNTKPMKECMTYTTLIDKKVDDKDLINYTRLGIKADFKSWIKNAVKGNYGLEIILSTEKQGTVGGEKETAIHTYTLDSSNMYGNPYNFETYYNQELVLDIGSEDIGKITNIKVNFYQAANFYDQFNEPIPSSLDGFKTEVNTNRYVYYPIAEEIGESVESSGYYIALGDKLNSNLFIDNLGIYFGYDISIFTNDYVEIYTQDRNSYRRSTSTETDNKEANEKNINMRWVHIMDGTPVDMVAAVGKATDNYEVRWYRYRVGAAAADEYSGIYWERMFVEKKEDNKYLLRDWVETDLKDEKPYYGELKTFQNLIFNPDVNKQQEKIKTIVVYENNTPYRSNELIFENEEQLPPNEEAQHIMNALGIRCNDGTTGNYMLYGQGARIKDQSHATKDRTLTCYFDTDNNGEHESEITDASALTWIFPNKNTMIEFVDIEIAENEKEAEKITRTGVANPKYRIAKTYNSRYSNNTIKCIYELNGVIYTSEIDFTFGKVGTMGSDQTLVIDFVGDTIAYAGEDTISFQIQLFNTAGVSQDIPAEAVKWEWYCNDELEEDVSKVINDKGNSILTFSFGEQNPKWNINKLHILQATIGTLTTYFPIPIKNGSYSYIDGPTEVIYRSDGKPDYSDLSYKLYDANGNKIDDVEWQIIASEAAFGYKYIGKLTSNKFIANKFYIRNENYIIKDDEQQFSHYTYQLQTNYNANAIYYERVLDNFIGAINKNTNQLEPVSIYIKDAPVYGIKAMIGTGENKTTVWSQPIFVCQNQYPSTVINQWDGKSLVLDEKNSAVIAAAISAGRKNSDNTFSGVMMGDWSNEGVDTDGSISGQTGLYGFHHGDMSYAFKEDGTGFIGKSSMARINFDGSEATIYSSGYNQTGSAGMMIDLYGRGENPYIELKSSDGKSRMKLDTANDGSTIYMSRSDGSITITNTNATYPLKIGDNFSVKWNGDITANGGTIGNWHIRDGKLESDDGYIVLSTESYGSIIIGSNNTNRIKIDASDSGIINMSSNSILKGGIIKAGTLESNNPSDRITLNGYLTVGGYGHLGYITSNIPGASQSPGIGMDYTINNRTYGEIKVTSGNAGMNFGNNYISLGSSAFAGGQTRSGIIIGGDNIVCNIEAGKQWGIYARFA